MYAALGETNGSSPNKKYYTVDATWFRRAWPYLNAKVDSQEPVSPHLEKDLGPFSAGTTWSTAQHPTDFVVVGFHVWSRLKKTFGVMGDRLTFARPIVQPNPPNHLAKQRMHLRPKPESID